MEIVDLLVFEAQSLETFGYFVLVLFGFGLFYGLTEDCLLTFVLEFLLEGSLLLVHYLLGSLVLFDQFSY
jgi:hypothetical protein